MLELMKCPMCGANVSADEGVSVAECPACGSEYFVESSKKLGSIDEAISCKLKNLRNIQSDAVGANDIGSISKSSYDILEIVAGDGLSQYYYAYAENVLGHNAYIKDYYGSESVNLTPSDTRRVLSHVYEYSDLRDRIDIESFIMALDGVDNCDELKLYKAQYATRRAMEDNYDDIPRDIFVCHRSTDIDVAEQVVTELEEDSHKCWISTRNLRPNDTINYWDNITKAINSCSIFLVISSEDAMMSKDIKSEINIAKSLGKARVEYKIDNSVHTSLFNDFFDGKMWVDGVGNTKRQLADLCIRSFREIDRAKYEKSMEGKSYNTNYSNGARENIKVDQMLQETRGMLYSLNFIKAIEVLEEVQKLAPNCGEMWWLKMLANNRISDEKDIAGVLADYTSDINYINAITYSSDHEQKIIWTGLVMRAKENLVARQSSTNNHNNAQQNYGNPSLERKITDVLNNVVITGKNIANNVKTTFNGSTPSYYDNNKDNTFKKTSANKKYHEEKYRKHKKEEKAAKKKSPILPFILISLFIIVIAVVSVVTMNVDVNASTDVNVEQEVMYNNVAYTLNESKEYYEFSHVEGDLLMVEIAEEIGNLKVKFVDLDYFTNNYIIKEICIDAEMSAHPLFTNSSSLIIVRGVGFDTITEIPVDAYRNCTSLVTAPKIKGLIKINQTAFYNCTSLTSFYIGESLNEIGERAFYNCDKLYLRMPNEKDSYIFGYFWDKGINGISWLK